MAPPSREVSILPSDSLASLDAGAIADSLLLLCHYLGVVVTRVALEQRIRYADWRKSPTFQKFFIASVINPLLLLVGHFISLWLPALPEGVESLQQQRGLPAARRPSCLATGRATRTRSTFSSERRSTRPRPTARQAPRLGRPSSARRCLAPSGSASSSRLGRSSPFHSVVLGSC